MNTGQHESGMETKGGMKEGRNLTLTFVLFNGVAHVLEARKKVEQEDCYYGNWFSLRRNLMGTIMISIQCRSYLKTICP